MNKTLGYKFIMFFLPILKLKDNGLEYKGKFYSWDSILKIEKLDYTRTNLTPLTNVFMTMSTQNMAPDERMINYKRLNLHTQSGVINLFKHLCHKETPIKLFNFKSENQKINELLGENHYKTNANHGPTPYDLMVNKILDNSNCEVVELKKEQYIDEILEIVLADLPKGLILMVPIMIITFIIFTIIINYI